MSPPEGRSLPFLLLLHHVLLCYALNPPFYLTKPLGAKMAVLLLAFWVRQFYDSDILDFIKIVDF